MKILVLTPYFHPHLGGSERYIEELYGELMRQNKNVNVDVLTYNTNQSSKLERYRGFNIYRVGCWEILPGQFALPNYLELYQLLKKLKANQYDLVNAHTRFFDTAWWGFLAAKYLGAKSILTDHCASHPQHKNAVVKLIAKLIDLLLMPLLSKVYDQITVVSQATKDFWIKQIGNAGKIAVITNSVSESLLIDKKPKNSKISVRFIGRNIAAKGASFFDQVAKELKPLYKEVVFERVGGVSHQRVMDLLQQTTIFVHPSTHHEGLPTILLEAGLASCAVVATNVGGTREIIKDGVSGLLVEPTDESVKAGIESLLRNQDKAKMMSSKLKERILGKYLWKQTAKKYERLLVSLVKKS